MLISCEETFGPVAPLYRFKSEEEAIARANNLRLLVLLPISIPRTWRGPFGSLSDWNTASSASTKVLSPILKHLLAA